MHRGVGGHVSNANRGSNNVYDGKIAGLYDLEETLGRGHFAVVKLARHVFTGEKVAVKVIDKSKLDEVSRSHLFQEVRCMKLVQHPNVVRLYEVIDTQTKLYLILELGDGGDLYDYIMRHESGLTEQIAREYFRQIVRAISYCHRLHVVHRDLKPENVVFFEKLGVVKLTDFGFSNKFCPGQKLETSCGSLAYSAPEILLGDSYDAPAVDVWSLGVILYMLVCGQAPFQEANDSETLTMIMDCKYTIPPHVSQACKNLIGKMLIREPEKRASLQQIANDPWLAEGQSDQSAEYLPLVSRQQLTEEDHNIIIQKIVNGNIATKEEILEALDKNEYNHITATYYLLAERKLRAYRQEQIQKKRPEQLSIAPQTKSNLNRTNDLLQVGNNNLPNPNLLSVPRTPGELPQRARKCSIVQEEEDEEDLSSCSGREELNTGHCSLNRRGSRSEGKLNVALQERIAESERRREALKPPIISKSIGDSSPNKLIKDDKLKLTPKKSPVLSHTNNTTNKSKSIDTNNMSKTIQPTGTQWRMGVKHTLGLNTLNSRSMDSATPTQVIPSKPVAPTNVTTTTTILNESSTISIPIHTSPNLSSQVMPKYKTMPSPTRPVNSVVLNSPNQLNEIFEEGDYQSGDSGTKLSTRNNIPTRTQARTTNYEQRRSKFHKARTASCSSSDASDDDSENRKKRAHKINSAGKPLPGRRDSYDDSSDSQDQGGIGGSGSGAPTASRKVASSTATDASQTRTNSTNHSDNKTNSNNNNNSNNRKTTSQPPNFSRRHRNGRRRTGETRLRESQSLNRITEVQEDLHSIVITTAALTPTTPNVNTAPSPKTKSSFGARLLHGWSLGTKKIVQDDDKSSYHQSRKDCNNEKTYNSTYDTSTTKYSPKQKSKCCYLEEKENFKLKIVSEKTNSKKMRILGRYFQVHKKLCIPLPGIFGRGRIYKAQSCSSLARDRITTSATTASIVNNIKDRPMSEVRNSLGNKMLGSDSDINQNNGIIVDAENNGIVPLRSVCNGIVGSAGICQIHHRNMTTTTTTNGGDATSKCQLC